MKRFLPLVLLFGVALTPSADAQFTLGVGAVYGFESEYAGLQGNAYFSQGAGAIGLGARFAIGGDVTYYFTDDADGVVSTSLLAINPNLRFELYQNVTGEIGAYALGGLNIARSSVEVEGTGADASETELGVNLGAGVNYSIGFGLFYAEGKYVIGGMDQVVIGAGLRFPLGN